MTSQDTEMRLCWADTISHDAHEMRWTHEWQPLRRADLLDLKIIVRVGNEIYGPGTHWIEFR